MLIAGTLTGFIEALGKARGVVNFSTWVKRISGAIVAAVGVWLVWQVFYRSGLQ